MAAQRGEGAPATAHSCLRTPLLLLFRRASRTPRTSPRASSPSRSSTASPRGPHAVDANKRCKQKEVDAGHTPHSIDVCCLCLQRAAQHAARAMVSLGSVGGRECASRSQRRPSALRRSPSDSQLLHILKKRTESEPIKRYAVEHMQACGQPRLYSRVTRDDPRLREMSHAGVRQLRLYSRGAGQAQARGEPRGAERSREEPRGAERSRD